MHTVQAIRKKEDATATIAAPAVVKFPVNGNSPAAEAWEWLKLRKMADRQADKIIALMPLVLSGNGNEAVNKLRVTARRLECILDLLYPRPYPRHVQKFMRKLKRCRRSLGELRNYDALLLLAGEMVAHKPAAESDVWETVHEYLQDRKQQNTPEALKKFSHINIASSYTKWKCGTEPASNHQPSSGHSLHDLAAHAPAKEILYQRIMHSLEEHWQAFEDAVEKSQRHPREEAIHSMRTAAKRLRYLMEVMKKLHIPGSEERLVWLRTLQEVIGRWHDLELLEHLMADMVGGPRFQLDYPQLAEKTQKMIAFNRKVKSASQHKFFWMTRQSHHYVHTKQWISGMMKTHGKAI